MTKLPHKPMGFNFDEALKSLQAGQPRINKGGILTPLIKQLTEAALAAEREAHIDSEPTSNRKNGSTRKTIKSTSGSFSLDTPRQFKGKLFALSSTEKCAQKIDDEWAVALCVLMVRFAQNNVKSPKLIGVQSRLIKDAFEQSPFIARRYAFPLIAYIQPQIWANIKAHDCAPTGRVKPIRISRKINQIKKPTNIVDLHKNVKSTRFHPCSRSLIRLES